MKQLSRTLSFLVLLNLATTGLTTGAALADTGNITVKTGNGTEMVLRKGYFGGEERSVKDKRGNKIGTKRSGLFGTTKETEVSFFGNGIKKKKGLFGGTKYEGKTILGDSIESKRGLFGFGRRNTNVDLSGTTNLVKQFIGSKKLPPITDPAQRMPAGAMSGLSQQEASDLLNNTQMPGQTLPQASQDQSSSTF